MILVVDDHADTREAMILLLQLEGHTAVAAGSGRQALELLEALHPRLIILDYAMPEMDGLTLLAQLRANARLAQVPVILFSAEGNAAVREAAMAAGVAAYVSKASLDWAALQHEVRRLAGAPSHPCGLPEISPPRASDTA
jgi:CheY-like chemotaxis protein